MGAVAMAKRPATRSAGGRDLRRAVPIVLPLILLVLPLVTSSPQHHSWVAASLLWALWVASLNIVWGYVGLLSVAQLALGAIAAYWVAILGSRTDTNLAVLVVVGVVLSMVASVLLGAVSTRLKGFYFTIITIAFALTVSTILMNWDVAGRTTGLMFLRSEIPVIHLGPYELIATTTEGFYVLTAIVFVLANAIAALVLYSRAGRAMRAVRDDPQLARSLGFSPAAIRTLAFALSGALAGVAGILHAYSFQLVVPELFAIDQALLAVMLIVLAGLGNVWAPVIAGIIYLLLYQVAPIDGDLRAGLLGLVVILVILLLPRGIVDAVPAWRRARAHRATHHLEEASA